MTVSRNDFHRSDSTEPHTIRRKLILEKHPEIEKLFESDIRPVPIVLLIIASQLFLAYFSHLMRWPVYFLVSWIYGGAASHALSLMTHELSHNLVFRQKNLNDYFGIFCNIGMGFPSSTMFKRYHMEHHQFQGYFGTDADIPTVWEGKYIFGPFRKALYLLFQSAVYGGRPSIVKPKKFRFLDLINITVIAVSDCLVVYFCGLSGLLYLILSLVLGMGFHPVAGHFISEHYIFVEGYETYSYYGCLNLLCWNVGYHNEHHDFPRVPGWKLPLVKKLAPEFYDDLPQHSSWVYVLWRFVFDASLGPFSRVIRGNNVPPIVSDFNKVLKKSV
jgi:sphingolipid delta-4 desaturase